MSQALLPRLQRRLLPLPLPSAHRRALSSAAPLYGGGGERRRGHDEESKAVKVSVWWDFENCHVPTGVNVCRIGPRVTAALRASGIRGPVGITAFGDVAQLARPAQEALAATGVAISHVPHSGKNSSDRSFMADLVYWIAQNPPPAHFFLISGDKDFANILHRLRMSNYNVLLACPNSATSVLCSAATIMWPWESLVKGEDFSPKYFNHPPDGSPGSWYGYHKGALDDPFLDTEPEEFFALPSDIKPRAIPKAVVNGIRQVLYSYPEGVNLSELRAELKRNNVFVDKDFFGYKKFSTLLQSMPTIVKFIQPRSGEDQPAVIGIYKRLVEPSEQSSKTMNSAQSSVGEKSLRQTQNEEPLHPEPSDQSSKTTDSAQSNVGEKSVPQTQNEKPLQSAVLSCQSDVLSKDQNKSQPAGLAEELKQPPSHKEADVGTAAGTPPPSGAQDTVSKAGLFDRIWILWNGPEPMKSDVSPSPEGTHAKVANELSTPQQGHNADKRGILLKRISKTFPRNENSDGSDCTSAISANSSTISADGHSDKLKHEEKLGMLNRDTSVLESSEPHGDASVSSVKAEKKDGSLQMNKGLFSWVERWFGKSDAGDSTTSRNVTDGARTDSDKESESFKAPTGASGQHAGHEMFTKSYFWDALEQHLSTPNGSDLVSKVKTREELAHELQQLGCWPLKGLNEKDLHQLVELLLLEKKWIEETSSKKFPFRLTLPQRRTCVPSHSSKSSGLSYLFANGKPLEQGKHVDDRSRTNRPLTREEMLSDCHKLSKELLLQYEYGFSIVIFKRLFAQKYGYELDYRKLGYPELESLLQIMPGVSIKGPMVLPAENGKGGKGNGSQSNGDDFIWEELGPVSDTIRSPQEMDKEIKYHPPTLSDDEFSDDDNHTGQQPKKNAEQSSLLQIIDSWSSSKDGDPSKKPHGTIDGLVDCSGSNPGYPDNLIPGNTRKPIRPSHKQYSFVSDLEEDKEKDKLVESVLGSLQKARDTRLHG